MMQLEMLMVHAQVMGLFQGGDAFRVWIEDPGRKNG
jgi:hypothetical protein